MNTVTTYGEVKINASSFVSGLGQGVGLEDLIPYFRAWYYIPELDIVAPSKYIGYEGITPAVYMTKDGLDGKETEPVLAKWFTRLDADSPEGKYIAKKADYLARPYGKYLNRVARFNAPKGWRLSDKSGDMPECKNHIEIQRDSDVVDVYWRAYLGLSTPDQKALAERITKFQH